MIEVVREHVVHMLHTHDGSRVAMMCLWHGTAKVRIVLSVPPFLFMVAICNRADHYIFMLWFVLLLLLFFSSPNLSRRRLDVCHTSTHGVALVRI